MITDDVGLSTQSIAIRLESGGCWWFRMQWSPDVETRTALRAENSVWTMCVRTKWVFCYSVDYEERDISSVSK